ncbi:hypothetical protein ACIQTW_00370 [Paenarthrobacter sp. NPDC090517]
MIRTPATESDANCALFLASDEASYVTGANLMATAAGRLFCPDEPFRK